MRIGAVILTYRDAAAAAACAKALSSQTLSPAAVVAVDNASDDGTAEHLRRAVPGLHIVELPANDGYGAGMNAGVAALADRDCDAYLFLTHDCVLDAGAVEVLAEALVARPQLAAVGPLLRRSMRPSEVWSAGGDLVGPARRPRHRLTGLRVDVAPPTGVEVCQWLDGAAILVRRTCFESVDGFREDLFLYWEDVDVALRLHDHGWDVACVLNAHASQEPSMVPPYLMSRNKLRVLWGRRDATGLLAALAEALAAAARDLLRVRPRSRGLRSAQGRLTGLVHAVSGRLDRAHASRR